MDGQSSTGCPTAGGSAAQSHSYACTARSCTWWHTGIRWRCTALETRRSTASRLGRRLPVLRRPLGAAPPAPCSGVVLSPDSAAPACRLCRPPQPSGCLSDRSVARNSLSLRPCRVGGRHLNRRLTECSAFLLCRPEAAGDSPDASTSVLYRGYLMNDRASLESRRERNRYMSDLQSPASDRAPIADMLPARADHMPIADMLARALGICIN